MTKALQVAEAGSKIQREFEADQELANKYLAEANAKDLYELYLKRCRQLYSFGETLSSMAEMYAGKAGTREGMHSTADAVAAMERVAMASIELAKAVAGKGK